MTKIYSGLLRQIGAEWLIRGCELPEKTKGVLLDNLRETGFDSL